MWGAVLIAVAALVAGVTVAVVHSEHKPTATPDTASATLSGPAGPEGIPLEEGTVLAPASTAASGATVGGISCDTNEQVAYHIHTHLSVYVNGALRPIPPGIGIVMPVAQQTANGPFYGASHCYYWLHVHAQDGIIHIEAPSQATYTLGQFFGIWQQPLSPTQVGPASGTVTAYVDGSRYSGDPTSIPLKSHEDVQLDVGNTVPPRAVNWSGSQL